MDVRSSISDSEARDWVATLRDRWRLQIMSRRVKRGRDGRVSEIPSRIRRFVEGIPWAHVKSAIDALLAAAPYEGVIANGVDFGIAYRPTLTVWQRDAQQAAVGAVRPDATYTLIQDLVEADSKDFYGVGSQSSCSETAETEYVWDAAEVEELPRGTQGVTYAIAAVNRKDDGTFDYQIVKRTAITQHVEETVVRDDVQSRVTQELWDNVYTDGEGGYVDETGAALSIPSAGIYDNGDGARTAVRIEGLSENPDCTLKFQVVRETAKPAGVRSTCRKTEFEHEHGTATSGNLSVPDHVPAAGGGHYEEIDGQLQPDGTYVVTSKKTDEIRQVSGKEYRRTPRAKITTTTTRNTPETASMPSRPGRESHEMTPGGRYNLTVVQVEASPTPDSARCVKTVFEETDDDVKMDTAIQAVHAKAGGGVHSEIVQDMDEYGIVKKVVRTTTETPQPGAAVEVRKTPRAVIRTTTDRNVAARAGIPAGFGGRESHEMTPGGLYNHTVTTATPSGTPDSARCAKTVFEHVHDAVSMADSIVVAEATAGGGVHSEVVQDMDEYGIVKKVVRTTTETPQPNAAVEVRKTPRAVIRTTTDRNVTDRAGVPAGFGGRESHEMTPGGLYNHTVTTATPSGTPDSARCSMTVFEHVHDTVSMNTRISSGDATAGGGHFSEIVQDMDEYGIVKKVVRTTTETPQLGATEGVSVQVEGATRTTVHRNQRSPYDLTGLKVGWAVRNDLTPGGAWNQTITQPENVDRGILKEGCERTWFVHTHETVNGRGAAVPATVEHDFVRKTITLKENVLTGSGSWNRRVVDRIAEPHEKYSSWTDVNNSGWSKITYDCWMLVFRNWSDLPVPGSESPFYLKAEHYDFHYQLNEFGLYDGVLTGKTFVSAERDDSARTAPGPGGTYEGDITVYTGPKEDPTRSSTTVHFTTYRNPPGVFSTGFLKGACDFPALGLRSSDTGTSGIKYSVSGPGGSNN